MSLLRLLLFPFSILYGIVIFFRNFLFEYGIIQEKVTILPTIGVGNISIGGTGKTPFTETLIDLFYHTFEIAILSRGYGRKTKGFRWVEVDSHPDDVGDEMLQVKRRYPKLPVAVCESRYKGALRIREECPEINLLILDDVYQHRYLHRDVNILLTTYRKPFFKDYLLPMGNLREFRYARTRADIVVLTKCPPGSTRITLRKYLKRLRLKSKQYATYAIGTYSEPQSLFSDEIVSLESYQSCLLVTGIADATDLIEYLETKKLMVDNLEYRDHAIYNDQKIKEIKERFAALNEDSKACIITTQKDAVKISEYKDELSDLPIFTLTYSFELDPDHLLKKYILPGIFR